MASSLHPFRLFIRSVALDGKTLRGSKNQGACDVHLLSAVSHGLGLTRGVAWSLPTLWAVCA